MKSKKNRKKFSLRKLLYNSDVVMREIKKSIFFAENAC